MIQFEISTNAAILRRAYRPAFMAIAFVLMATVARAQSLLGIQIGDSTQRLNTLGSVPAVTDTYKSFTLRKWTFPEDDEFSATIAPSGRVSYMELDWGGKSSRAACDLSGIVLGVTTLTDIRKRFGGNGFEFQDRVGVVRIPNGVVMLNSYEIGTVVVTFYTKALKYSSSQTSTDETPPIADRAKLDAISIADADYAASEWGKRIYDPNYKKAEWK
jgi:hypothetical protein